MSTSTDLDDFRSAIGFIIRQLQNPTHVINKILTHHIVPLSNSNPRFKKILLLRELDTEIEDGSVSEKTLDSIEMIEEIDREEGDLILDSMKKAYCAVAVECTVKYMLGNLQRARKKKFLEAVKSVWNERVCRLEREGRSELVTDEMMECWEDMKFAVWNDGLAKRWVKRNTRNEAVAMVNVYLGEAVAVSGPVFIEMVARMGVSGRGGGENGGVKVNEDEDGGLVNEAVKRSREGGVGENGVMEVDVDNCGTVCFYFDYGDEEGCLGLADGNLELGPADKPVENGREGGDKELMGVKVGGGRVCIDVDAGDREGYSRLADENLELGPADKPAKESRANLSKKATAGIASYRHQKNVSKPRSLKRNATARTFEWDDSIEDSSEGTGDQMKRFHLDSQKRKVVSPLKKYELARISKRRKPKKWSLEEEDALREAVKKYGVGNWKLMWISNRDIFQARTQVDLKDKWRNMTRLLSKIVAPIKRSKVPIKITNREVAVGQTASSLEVSTDEVNRVLEALRASSKELLAMVKDPLPDAILLSRKVIAELARKSSNQGTLAKTQREEDAGLSSSSSKQTVVSSAQMQSGKDTDACNSSAHSTVEPFAENLDLTEVDAANPSINQTAVPSVRNDKGKGVDAPNLSANLSKKANAGITSCSHQNNVSKEQNATARTVEWKDSIEDSSEGTGDQMKRLHLDSQKRKAVSLLKKDEWARVSKRRNPKKWSLEEEDALRVAVKKYGIGNWKLMWISNRDIFQARTQVDLKDKWRNMTIRC